MERSRDWLDQAQGDLEHARADLRGGYHDWACFSAQQAAEKAVKAVFQRLGAEAWGHSVADLLGELASRHGVPEALRDAALELDKAYSRRGIRTHTPPALPGRGTPRPRRPGSSIMRRASSSSVRVFFPKRDRAAVAAALTQRLPRLAAVLPLRRVVLFGSYASNRHTVASDVDVLVVYRGEARDDAYALTRRLLALPGLEPHLYTDTDYRAAAATIDRMTRGGVTLFEAPP